MLVFKAFISHKDNSVVALGFSIDGFEMPNQTIYFSIKFSLSSMCYIFVTAAPKIDGFNEPILTPPMKQVHDLAAMFMKLL